MISSFLPIFTSSPNDVSGHVGAGANGLRHELSDQGGGPQTFFDVLGSLQPALQDEASTALLSLDGQAILSETVLTDQEILDELAGQGLILLEQQGTFSLQLASTPVSNGEATQHGLNAANTLKTLSGAVSNQDEGHAFILQAQALLNRLNSLGSNLGEGLAPAHGEAVRGITKSDTNSPIPAQILTLTSEKSGAVAQSVIGNDVRVQPLVRDTSQGILDPRLLSTAAPATSPDPGVTAQRLSVSLEGVGTTPQVIAENLTGGTILQTSRDELTQGLSRVEGESKILGPLGTTQGAESGTGHGGHGLPFGNHTGTGQGQVFDSSPGSHVLTSQTSLVAKGGSFDERLQLFNASVPHRLQIDVQLSEAARMQVDIGVQQRQVYAGVLLDNPVLRALASQNVQQLEAQLGQAEMELEEFDVHEDNSHLHEELGSESSGGHEQSGRFSEQGEGLASSHELEHVRTTIQQDRGWHLVA
ncbi:hypothetical protein [Nitrospira sp. M1]